MAQGTTHNANTLFVEAAIAANGIVHDGVPYVPVSGDEGVGYLVPLSTDADGFSAPEWFAHIRDAGTRNNVFRALYGHAMRTGQAKLKASKTPSRSDAVSGVCAALNGSYVPARERETDIVEREAMRQYEAYVRSQVIAQDAAAGKPAPSEKRVNDTIEKYRDTANGIKWRELKRAEIFADGTYSVPRKGKAAAGESEAAEISL